MLFSVLRNPNDKVKATRLKKALSNAELPCCKTSMRQGAKSPNPVEPFKPVSIPAAPTLVLPSAAPPQKDLDIFIEQEKDTKCLKKLFAKVHKLKKQVNEFEAQNSKLRMELQHYIKREKECGEHITIIGKLNAQIAKLTLQMEHFQKLSKSKSTPNQDVLVVEKPFQVRVEVPKYIEGPERIVEVKVPEIIQKTIYVDKPVIVEKPVYIEIPAHTSATVAPSPSTFIEHIPFEVPVYIDRPVINQQTLTKLRLIETELADYRAVNENIDKENRNLKVKIHELIMQLELLNMHNSRKNDHVEHLLRSEVSSEKSRSFELRTTTNKHPDNLGSIRNRQELYMVMGNLQKPSSSHAAYDLAKSFTTRSNYSPKGFFSSRS